MFTFFLGIFSMICLNAEFNEIVYFVWRLDHIHFQSDFKNPGKVLWRDFRVFWSQDFLIKEFPGTVSRSQIILSTSPAQITIQKSEYLCPIQIPIKFFSYLNQNSNWNWSPSFVYQKSKALLLRALGSWRLLSIGTWNLNSRNLLLTLRFFLRIFFSFFLYLRSESNTEVRL